MPGRRTTMAGGRVNVTAKAGYTPTLRQAQDAGFARLPKYFACGKSQAEIARKLRMSSSSYRKFEDGKTLLGLHHAVRLRDYWRARGEKIDLDFLGTGGVEM